MPVAAYNRGPMNVRALTRGIVMGGRAMVSQMPSAMINAQHAMDNFRRETSNEMTQIKGLFPGMKEEMAKLEGVVNKRVQDVQDMILQQKYQPVNAFAPPAPEVIMDDASGVDESLRSKERRRLVGQGTQVMSGSGTPGGGGGSGGGGFANEYLMTARMNQVSHRLLQQLQQHSGAPTVAMGDGSESEMQSEYGQTSSPPSTVESWRKPVVPETADYVNP